MSGHINKFIDYVHTIHLCGWREGKTYTHTHTHRTKQNKNLLFRQTLSFSFSLLAITITIIQSCGQHLTRNCVGMMQIVWMLGNAYHSFIQCRLFARNFRQCRHNGFRWLSSCFAFRRHTYHMITTAYCIRYPPFSVEPFIPEFMTLSHSTSDSNCFFASSLVYCIHRKLNEENKKQKNKEKCLQKYTVAYCNYLFLQFFTLFHK